MENTTEKNINRVFIWILVVISFAFALCCVTPYTYLKFQPTSTPFPTPTIIPTATIDIQFVYVTTLREGFSRQASLMQLVGTIVRDATLDDTRNPEWRTNLYSKYDEIISISESSKNLPPPPGWEHSQEILIEINKELILARVYLVDFIENQNINAVPEFGKHINLMEIYLKELKSFFEQKGYY